MEQCDRLKKLTDDATKIGSEIIMYDSSKELLVKFDRLLVEYQAGRLSEAQLRLFRIELEDDLKIYDSIYYDNFRRVNNVKDFLLKLGKSFKSKSTQVKEFKAKIQEALDLLNKN